MTQGLLDNNVITQIAIVVYDIDKTAQAYADVFGIDKPTWIWTGPLEEAHTEYRGGPTPGRAKLAFMRFGSLDLELIEPDEHPSTWREHLDKYGESVHHIAFEVKGMADKVHALAVNGMPLVQRGDYTGGRYAYIDAIPNLKVMLELLENE